MHILQFAMSSLATLPIVALENIIKYLDDDPRDVVSLVESNDILKHEILNHVRLDILRNVLPVFDLQIDGLPNRHELNTMFNNFTNSNFVGDSYMRCGIIFGEYVHSTVLLNVENRYFFFCC